MWWVEISELCGMKDSLRDIRETLSLLKDSFEQALQVIPGYILIRTKARAFWRRATRRSVGLMVRRCGR
jgi:hypothetical protein